MRLRRVLNWMMLALVCVPVTAVWCLVWLWWNATARGRNLPPGGEPLAPERRHEMSEASWGAPEFLPRA